MRDLDELAVYIAADSEQNAELIEARIHETARLLSVLPGSGRPGRIRSTRERVILRTPYILVYRIQRGIVRILRIYHGARKWPVRFD